uniref:F-box domain-containing protein n=1 Tax=Entomoneis paludosa TaxID=265537 RepID=A0A7S2VF14_9STRA|mmetsp:Transcript_19889/g.41495  ORF Transcript_19889/g.41495 Transcript_19889/m.41495 type:complete len:776 (+) Transcript_19889:160-2487(+)
MILATPSSAETRGFRCNNLHERGSDTSPDEARIGEISSLAFSEKGGEHQAAPKIQVADVREDSEGEHFVGQAHSERSVELPLRPLAPSDSERWTGVFRNLENKADNEKTDQSMQSLSSGESDRGALGSRPPTEQLLKSCFKRESTKKGGGVTRRRIRGLWDEGQADLFSLLRETTLQLILSFLSMQDIGSLSGVSNRWRALALDPSCWKDVDATDFVAVRYRRLAKFSDAARKTSEALSHCLRKFSPEKLSIRSIKEMLSPDYLPAMSGLRQLVLTDYLSLSDTHVHVMLLSASDLVAKGRTKNTNSIRKLVLDNCPLLTNSSLRSIATQCRQLEELSIRGCAGISDVTPLRELFKTDSDQISSQRSLRATVIAPPKLATTPTRPAPSSGLASLFSPPPPAHPLTEDITKANHLTSLFDPPVAKASSSSTTQPTGLASFFESPSAPPPSEKELSKPSGLAALFDPPSAPSHVAKAPQKSSGLASLFELPGASSEPPKSSGFASFFEAPSAAASSRKPSGLASLFTPAAMDSVGNGTFSGQSCMNPGGQLAFLDFSHTSVTAPALVSVVEAMPGGIALKSLEMKGSGESWTDAAVSSLSSCHFKAFDICCSNLKAGSNCLTDLGFRSLALNECEKLSISGQKGIKIGALTKALSSAQKLQSLDVESCTSLFQGDEPSTAGMVFALQNSSSLEYVNIARCFSDETTAESSPQVLKEDEERGRLFIDAICNSASRWTLRELDLRWCWFVTASEVAKVRRACPKLERLHLLGTRCNEVI